MANKSIRKSLTVIAEILEGATISGGNLTTQAALSRIADALSEAGAYVTSDDVERAVAGKDFVVTLSADDETGDMELDKSVEEIYEAYTSGKNVSLKFTESDTSAIIILQLSGCMYGEVTPDVPDNGDEPAEVEEAGEGEEPAEGEEAGEGEEPEPIYYGFASFSSVVGTEVYSASAMYEYDEVSGDYVTTVTLKEVDLENGGTDDGGEGGDEPT